MVLKQPVPASVSESEAITDDVLVSAALEMFGEANNDTHAQQQAQAQAQAPTSAATHVAGVIKSPSNHLVSPSPELCIYLFDLRVRESRYSLSYWEITDQLEFRFGCWCKCPDAHRVR